MTKTKHRKNCEECEEEHGGNGPGSLRERIWETQLAEKREIYLNGNIDDSVIEKVVVQIQNFNAHDDLLNGMKGFVREPIKLFITSNGGEIYAGLAVCAAIEASKTPVITVALGKAISAGFLILICGDQRYADKYVTLMHHTGSSGTQGTITDIIEEADSLEKLNEKIHLMIREHTNISDEQLDEVFYRKNNWYLSLSEALELGVVDGIWPPDVYQFSEDPEDGNIINCEDCGIYNPDEPCATCELTDNNDCDCDTCSCSK